MFFKFHHVYIYSLCHQTNRFLHKNLPTNKSISEEVVLVVFIFTASPLPSLSFASPPVFNYTTTVVPNSLSMRGKSTRFYDVW